MILHLKHNKYSNKLNWYQKGSKTINEEENYMLLGFKDNLPVMEAKEDNKLKLSPKLIQAKSPNKLGTPKFEIDEKGEQFIKLNGQKLKVVPPERIPKEIKTRTILLKQRIPSIDLKGPLKLINISNQTTNIDKSPTILIPGTAKVKFVTDSKLEKVDHSKLIARREIQLSEKVTVKPRTRRTYQASSLQLIGGGLKREKLLCAKTLGILNQVKMKALNLSLKESHQVRYVQNKTKMIGMVEIGVQTDFKTHKDSMIQTDPQCKPLDELEIDFPLLNDANFGSGPHIVPLGGSMVELDMDMSKKLIFFQDLRECVNFDVNGNLPLHEGVIKGHEGIVLRHCVALKARKLDINVENHNGCTALQLAIIHEAPVNIVNILLDYGADISEPDSEGNNILHLIAKFQRYDILGAVLTHNAFDIQTECVNSFNFEGLTPLMLCCISNWTGGALLFMNNKANVNARDQTSGRTALFHAAEAHSAEIVRMLLDQGADPKIKNFFGTSPHDAMYELDDMTDMIKNLIFGRSKKRTIEAEMNPSKTAKAAKSLKTYPKLHVLKRDEIINDLPVGNRIRRNFKSETCQIIR
ncbi:hypothetical protein ABEB36_006751 [Hypothenemus hampei]|uniref:Uncharacterized protein n=1 Tax=Hypothenemus hampei TaxID=57062 RepID=A0ABD1ESE7_HYPHA